MAWLSPAYPIGAFSYSSGIEWAVEAGDINDRETLRQWLAVMIGAGGGLCDAVLFAHSYRAIADNNDVALHAVAQLAAAFAPSKERHLETTAQGRASSTPRAQLGPRPRSIGFLAVWDGDVAAAGRGGRRLRGTRHRARAGAARIPPCADSEPDLDRRAADFRLARPMGSACSPRWSLWWRQRGARARDRARRRRQRRLPQRYRQHASRDAVSRLFRS